MCKLLLSEYSADILKADSSGSLPLHESIRSKDAETFKFLLRETDRARQIKYQGTPNFKKTMDLPNNQGESPILIAVAVEAW